ncbi:MAG: ABC transporter ATP-binding protein [Clostridia bacterium]|nr:ABC transporter ATP-binding protein [Clostridia bacterium]
MDNEEYAIEIENLTKEYKMYNRKKDRLLEIVLPWYNHHDTFTAVDNLSIKVKKGEILGILGKNGAGKSTLLKMITGVVVPTKGTIKVEGKISSMLELGTAFNMELTGYENIYQHGQVMGLTNEEIKEKEQEIIDFADIGEHLWQPVKTYSSGMFARLAFACAINIEPEVLIVDEVLSVGDMAFQEKSITKMKEIRESGTTIIFVSHSLPSIKNFCTRAIWMENGKVIMDGDVVEVAEKYKESTIDKPRQEEAEKRAKSKRKERTKNKSIEITSVECDKKEYNLYEDINIKIKLNNIKKIKKYGVGMIIYNSKSDLVTALNTIRMENYLDEKVTEINFKIKRNCLNEDKYYVTISVCDEKIMFSYDKDEYATDFKVRVPKNSFGVPISEGFYACDYEIVKK